MTAIVEANFDGLVGPTHHFLNTSPGNRASEAGRGEASNPRAAAVQGLAKMATVAELGVPQGVIPPPPRPDVRWLRSLGFAGSDADVLLAARERAPRLLAAASSSSFMWAANAATVAPSRDTADGRLHLTPANLLTATHRSIESRPTELALRSLFADADRFAVHAALPACRALSDEGAANHTRFADPPGEGASAGRGVHLFVYGFGDGDPPPPSGRYPPRQGRLACEAIAWRHGLDPNTVVYARQHPEAIDAGAFHHDVVAVGHGRLMLAHERALADPDRVRAELEAARQAAGLGEPIRWHVVADDRLPLRDAIATYLFNSQLVTDPSGGTVLVAPGHCERHESTRRVIEADLLASRGGPIDRVVYVNVDDSMHNGGGPACLRLRVGMTAAERAAVSPGCWWTPGLHAALTGWVERWYRDAITLDDLADAALLAEGRAALVELAELLGLSESPYGRLVRDGG
jgi:succinylarginine dihydrolase